MPTIYKYSNVNQRFPPKHDSFYDTPQWRRLRARYIKENPLCEYCLADGFLTPGFILDHYLARRLFPELEWSEPNLMNACRSCDQTKRQLEANCHDREVLKAKLIENGFFLKKGEGGSNL